MTETISAEEYNALAAKHTGSKYGNVRVKEDGYVFASKLEARRYRELKLMEQQGAIADLRIHPRYPLIVNGLLICTYVADFSYLERRPGSMALHRAVEDTKGVRTEGYRLKKRLMKACRGIDVVEVT